MIASTLLFWLAVSPFVPNSFDLEDYAEFQICFGATTVSKACSLFDDEGDGDVDLSDFLAFLDSFCGFDNSGCPGCGNNVIEGTEICDGTDLGGADCASVGFDGGTLTCNLNCQYDTRGCFSCGNDIIEGGEVCDGTDVGGETCQTQGFRGGPLTCSPLCDAFDTSGCVECVDCSDCENQACNGGSCGACSSSADCCAPWVCFSGVCFSP